MEFSRQEYWSGLPFPSLLPYTLLNLAITLQILEGNGNPLVTLAWKIPWMEEPGRLQSMGLLGAGHD